MSELEELRAAKVERMKGYVEPLMRSACWEYACDCHDDLDRAIAIAESYLEEVKKWAETDSIRQLIEARAAVLALRDVVMTQYDVDDTINVLADTESFEQYRP